MKTPMQQMLEWVNDYPTEVPTIHKSAVIAKAKELLEEEKEVIMDAFQEGKWDGWENHELKTNGKESQWTDPADYYNKTFNTKEK